MTIKSSKGQHIACILLMIIFAIIFFRPLLDPSFGANSVRSPDGFWYVSIAVLFLFTFRIYVSVGRTLTMNQEGCTISFLCFRRTYKWSEFRVIRLIKCTPDVLHGFPYSEGCIFLRKRKKLHPDLVTEYSIFIRPYSFIYVYFKPEKELKKWYESYLPKYEIEKNIFMDKMHEWNVAVQAEGFEMGGAKNG